MLPKRLSEITIGNIKKGVELMLDAVLLENDMVGFPILKKYGKCPSVLFFVLPKNSPLIAGARYDMIVERVTVSNTFMKSGHQKIFAAVKMIRMVQYDNTYYLPEEKLLRKEIRSGRAVVKQNDVPIERIFKQYRDAGVVFDVSQVSEKINGEEKFYHFEILSGVSKNVLVEKKMLEFASAHKMSANTYKLTQAVKKQLWKDAGKEVDKFLNSLPQLPTKEKIGG